MTERRIELSERTFVASTDEKSPCPQCKQQSVIGVLFVNEAMNHMHTWYVCTFWPTGKRDNDRYEKTDRCGWTGWSVPRARAKKSTGLTDIKRIADLLLPKDRAKLYEDLAEIARTRKKGLT